MDAATILAPDGDQDTGRRAEVLRKFIVPLQESNTVIERVSLEKNIKTLGTVSSGKGTPKPKLKNVLCVSQNYYTFLKQDRSV